MLVLVLVRLLLLNLMMALHGVEDRQMLVDFLVVLVLEWGECSLFDSHFGNETRKAGKIVHLVAANHREYRKPYSRVVQHQWQRP